MRPDVFGHVRLGYVVAESNRLPEWKRFGTEGLGVHVDTAAGGSILFRLDQRERRLIVRPGPAEDVVALGIELCNGALETVCDRLRNCGVRIVESTDEEARERGVQRFVRIAGPKGQSFELFDRASETRQPLAMRASGFVTGECGMGHVAITTREPESMLAFWQDIFDARISDTIDDKIDGVQMDFTFLHVNPRHHSVAIAATRGVRLDPIRTKIHHLNIQAESLDDVTEAYLRCRRSGFAIANSIGEHPNDRELSFYVVTPSGFEIELGWRPIVVPGDRPWPVASYRGISLWGHFPESNSVAARLGRMGRGVRSLFRSEPTVDTGACRERAH